MRTAELSAGSREQAPDGVLLRRPDHNICLPQTVIAPPGVRGSPAYSQVRLPSRIRTACTIRRPRRSATAVGVTPAPESALTMCDRNDEELMLAAGKGDQATFDVITERHHCVIEHVAPRFLGNIGRETVEDLAQDAFRKAWKIAPEFEPRARQRLERCRPQRESAWTAGVGSGFAEHCPCGAHRPSSPRILPQNLI